MIHPHIKMAPADESVGVGLFATRLIPAGTLTWAQDPLDLIIEPSIELLLGDAYQEQLERYGWRDAAGRRILCWDHGRFMNHGCAPNSLAPGLPFEVAVRDILPGEEVLCDYAALNLEAAFVCLCGAATCRGSVRPEEFEALADTWDRQVRSAFQSAGDVEQPLLPILDPSTRRAFLRATDNPHTLPSVRAHRLGTDT